MCLAQGRRGHHRVLLQWFSTCCGTTLAFREISFILFSKALDGAVARCSFKYTLSTCSRKMFLALVCSTLLPSAPLAQLPCLTTAQRPAAHPQALDDTARWCWREILTASVLVKICPFGQVQLLLARGFPHSSAWQNPTAGHRHHGWSSTMSQSLAYGCPQTIPTSTQTTVTVSHCPQGQKICFIFSPVQFLISHFSC